MLELSLFILLPILTIIEIPVLLFSRIEPGKRRFILVLDFLAVLFVYCIFLFWLSIAFKPLVIPAILAFFLLYNVIFFKIVKKLILKNRALRINEEINETVIEALRSLAELDYKEAYEILEEALRKYPGTQELLQLRNYMERNIKKTNNDKG